MNDGCKRNTQDRNTTQESVTRTKNIFSKNGKIQSYDGKKNRYENSNKLVLIIKEFLLLLILIMAISFISQGMAISYTNGIAESICYSTNSCFMNNNPFFSQWGIINTLIGSLLLCIYCFIKFLKPILFILERK